MSSGNYRILSTNDASAWNEVLCMDGIKGDVFFTFEYCNLYKTTENSIEAFYYSLGGDIFFLPYIKAAIPGTDFFDIETPYGYGGVLSNTSDKLDEKFLEGAWSCFKEHCEKSEIMAGLIRFHPLIGNHELSMGNGPQVIRANPVVILDTEDKEVGELFRDYKSNTRNKIRLAEKNRVRIESGDTSEHLFIFKKIYQTTMERLKAESFYLFDAPYFDGIAEGLGGSFLVCISYIDDEPVGGSVLLFKGDYCTYFLSATTDKGRKTGAANLLRHEATKICKHKNIRFINFGGGRSPDKNDSLFKFKAGFSKQTEDFCIGKYVTDASAYSDICSKWEKQASPETIKAHGRKVLKYRY